MSFELLDTVVLSRDLPEHGLRAGDLGAVVEVYGDAGLEVEFVRASGQTKALVTLTASDLRSVAANDILAVQASKTALVKRGVGLSAIFLAVVGVLLLFAPEEVGGILVPDPGVASPFLQLLGAGLLGFGTLNWIGRHHPLGGIYGRAIVAGNQVHFTIGAVVLVKHGVSAGGSIGYWMLSALYVAQALFFSHLIFGSRMWSFGLLGRRKS